jgi:cyclic-di-AMP phosphodiesterase PgpH
MLLLHHEPTELSSFDYYIHTLRPLAFNGVWLVIVVVPTLKVFETWFGRLSNFSLLELTDFNQPLLKRMILEAPGTYHHSLVVSNIAEAAADAIGANSLLTRVGSYYHDIGKMDKPEYFAENQILVGNKHDNIEPSMSRLVILNHVKEGLELARKYKLNPVIHDFITQHHGTSLMYFFYQKALEDTDDGISVKEDSYRYPGPKPQTPETAIVLLADSAEAATRSLEDPTPHKIEELVRKIINNKFIDGQLDECNITLKAIEQIAKTFTRVLSAMYHGRVKYPEKKNGSDSRNSKQAEEDPNPPAPG